MVKKPTRDLRRIVNGSRRMERVRGLAESVRREVHRFIVGMDSIIDSMLVALLSGGHVILEGPPGLAKTYLVKAFASSLDLEFKRIQFTSDMLPSDITGSMVYNRGTGKFEFKKGPIFANLILADEINRAPPRSQSALLEAMQERQVTVEGNVYRLPDPFMVVATQNPIELEGTYPLPEAELDRFMLRVMVEPPGMREEVGILEMKNVIGEAMDVSRVAGKEEILDAIEAVKKVHVEPSVMEYIVRIVRATREDQRLLLGGSPRAAVFLMYASKAMAALRGKKYVTPDHVKAIAPHVLNHRFLVKPDVVGMAHASGYRVAEEIVKEIMAKVEVPR